MFEETLYQKAKSGAGQCGAGRGGAGWGGGIKDHRFLPSHSMSHHTCPQCFTLPSSYIPYTP